MKRELLTSESINRYIDALGESDNMDAKGPIAWDGEAQSARLAKDIVAFANSRDGGTIVIGKSEPKPGQFVLTGLTGEQADSFDTTKVSQWINSRFSPPVRLVCYQQSREGKRFVVISVTEFDDVPILCIKSDSDILREGALYVRTANAESAPLRSVEDLRRLIGLATGNRSDELARMFSTILKGGPLEVSPSEEEKFDSELAQVLAAFDAEAKPQPNAGSWQLVFHPGIYRKSRWADIEQLETIVRKHTVGIRGEFPQYYRSADPREWGISSDAAGQWALTYSGVFVCRRSFWENSRPYESPFWTVNQPREPDLPAGAWLDYKSNVFVMIELFMFMERLASECDAEEPINYHLSAGPLAGRSLVTVDGLFLGYVEPKPCRAHEFSRVASISVAEFRAHWKEECARAMKGFFELFPDVRIKQEILEKWVEQFKNRTL